MTEAKIDLRQLSLFQFSQGDISPSPVIPALDMLFHESINRSSFGAWIVRVWDMELKDVILDETQENGKRNEKVWRAVSRDGMCRISLRRNTSSPRPDLNYWQVFEYEDAREGEGTQLASEATEAAPLHEQSVV